MTRQMGDYIIAIDQSTSATKAMLFNDRCEMLQRVNMPKVEDVEGKGLSQEQLRQTFEAFAEPV